MNMAFRGLSYAQYEWRAFEQPLGSRTVLSLRHTMSQWCTILKH